MPNSMQHIIVSVLSQKGGVGKSFLAKLLATEFARLGRYSVLLADLDTSQRTSYRWAQRRKHLNIKPQLTVQSYEGLAELERDTRRYQLTVCDGFATTDAKEAKQKITALGLSSNLVILPCSSSIEELEPQIDLAGALIKAGVEKQRLLFVFNRLDSSKASTRDARAYLQETGFPIATEGIPAKPSLQSSALEGRAGSETKYQQINQACRALTKHIADLLEL